MKKVILILATLATSYIGFGQDIVVESALTSLKSGNYDDAKENIDRAIAYPGTKEKPKALFAKARIYMQIQVEKVPKYIASHPYREAAQALMKLAEVKPDYEKALTDNMLYNCAVNYYNDGVGAFNVKKSAEGIECMLSVVKIHDLNGGKRYEKYTADKFPVKRFDTLSANANASAAICYFLDTNYAMAIPALATVVANPITATASNYNALIECYIKKNMDNEMIAAIEAGRKLFPNDKTLKQNEIYYYSKTGKQEEFVKKLEAAAASEPDNANMQINLAIVYLDMFNAKDNTNKANSGDLVKKAEAAFTKALSLKPNDAVFNYNFGVLYYNQGRDANEQLNTLAEKINEKGNKNAKEEQKKYDALKITRDNFFGQSVTLFEKTNSIFSAKGSAITNEEKVTYKSCLAALKDAYTILGKDDKYKETKAKYDAMD